MAKPYGLYSSCVVLPEGVGEAIIIIERKQIKEVIRGGSQPDGIYIEDVSPLCIMPGCIDAHVHINEPGRTDWEGFDTATKAAAAGGVTTVVDMPLNSTPVTTTVAAFHEKLLASERKLHVNVGFWGGLVPKSKKDLPGLLESGVLGIKVFLCHSGIEDFPNVERDDLELAMPLIAQSGVPLLVHAEQVDAVPVPIWKDSESGSYKQFLNSRPREFENHAIRMMADLCRRTGCRTHIVHLSSAEALPDIRKIQSEGFPFTVETCGHYVFFTAESIPDRDCRYKCAPPIRDSINRELLIGSLKDGTLDFVTSDHSPAPPEMKHLQTGNLKEAWGGIGGISFTLPATWSRENFSLPEIKNLLSTNPAKFLGLGDRKGEIHRGYDADLVIWDPKMVYTIQRSDIFFRHKVSPYEGQQVQGKVIRTIINGSKVFDRGKFVNLNQGETILRKPVLT